MGTMRWHVVRSMFEWSWVKTGVTVPCMPYPAIFECRRLRAHTLSFLHLSIDGGSDKRTDELTVVNNRCAVHEKLVCPSPDLGFGKRRNRPKPSALGSASSLFPEYCSVVRSIR